MTHRLTIPGEFAGMNDIIAANRSRNKKWFGGSALKKREQARIFPYLGQITDEIRPPVYIRYRFYAGNRKRDLDNISGAFHKFFQDALVKSGKLENDSWGYITGFSDAFELDRKQPRIEIEIEEQGREQPAEVD